MPIRVQCACGKSMSVKDDFAGKAVKCPGCQKPLRVPAAGTATANRPSAGANSAAARPAGARPAGARPAAAAPPAPGGLDDLFDEEGLQASSGPTCPACSAAIKPGSVLCTQCGMNLQTGERMVRHQEAKAAAASAGLGHFQLDKAVKDMKEHEEMNYRTNNAGMPGWFLAIMLIFVSFFTFAAVSIVNAASAGDDATGLARTLKDMAANEAVVWGCIIAGVALQTIARLWLTVVGFMESAGAGLTTMFLWHKFLGQLSEHPFVGLVYALGLFTTLSGLGLMLVNYMA